MTTQPILSTERLTLRPFTLDDAPRVQELAGNRDLASTTLNLPHPYEDGMAEQWIGGHQAQFESEQAVNYAIVLSSQNLLVGAISLMQINQRHQRAEIGYWVGKSYWNQGYCTEAAHAVLHYAFDVLGLKRVYAYHFPRNPASGRVMQKIGMRHEGCLRQHVERWGQWEYLEVYGILRDEYS